MKISAHFDDAQCKQKGVISPVLIIVGGIILVIVVISVASGALKFEGSISKKSDQSTPSQSAPSTSTKTYKNESLGVSLEYPVDWSIKENPAAGVVVAFGSPKESSSDTFVDNVNVSTSDLSSKPAMTLDEVAALWQKQTKEDLAGGTFKLLETKDDQMIAQDAKRLIYTYSKEGTDIKGMVVIALKDKKAYIVTYTAEEKSFDKFLNDINGVVSSLQVN